MSRRLKIWNGRFYLLGTNRPAHCYVAAYSIADACALTSPFSRWDITPHEIRNYWSPGCWGNYMEGVAVERGLWVRESNEKPRRLV